MELLIVGLLLAVGIPAFVGLMSAGGGAALAGGLIAIIGIIAFALVNMILGGLIWLAAFLPAIMSGRAQSKLAIEERRHQETLDALRAAKK